MEKTRVYRHEDNGDGAKVVYNINLENISSSKPVTCFTIQTMSHEIYHDAKRQNVLFPPESITFRLDLQETIKMMGLFVEASSRYMYKIREKMYRSSILRYEFIPKDSNYTVLFHAIKEKHQKSGRSINTARLLLSIFDKDTNEEKLTVRIKVTKIVILLQIVKSLFEEYIRKISLAYEDIEGRRLSLLRISDQVAIGDVWIHGREVQKFQDYIERIIFDFKYGVGQGSELFKYRQVSAVFSAIENVAKIKLVKYNSDHTIHKNENGDIIEHEFLVTSECAAYFYLLLPTAIEFNAKDTELPVENLESSDEEANVEALTTEDSLEELLSIGNETEKTTKQVDKRKKSTIEHGDFILNMIESQLALKVLKNQKFSAKKRQGKLQMSLRYRDFVLEDENYTVGRTNGDTGKYEIVEKLPKCDVDLKIDWLYIFAVCAQSLYAKEELINNEYGMYKNTWVYAKKSLFGAEKYGVSVLADNSNKAAVVLAVDYAEVENEDAELPMRGGARLRIPLFREHVRTLIKGLISLSREFDEYFWVRSFPIYSELFELTDKKLSLGIKRVVKDGEEVVSFGVVGKGLEQVYLTDSDRDTLFFSAYNRLMYGRWLQFSGEQIAISFDGWLTDRFNEYKIEFDIEDTAGAKGALAALAMVFATARNKNNKGI